MTISGLGRYALFSSCVAVAMLGGCAQGDKAGDDIQPPIAAHAPGFYLANATTVQYRLLYNFLGSTDGANPRAGLLNANGKFYGTTSALGVNNAGTIFSL